MALQDLRVGFLFSSTGSYELVSRSMLNGALLAVAEINATNLGVRIDPTVLNPGGDLAKYPVLAADLFKRNIRHVVGCYTSSSRKEVIPLFEKHDALLWYPSHYEGFESSTSVVYTGAAPNQHVLPLVEYLLQLHGHRAFCVGSNYIWAWENNRILRESVTPRGGSVLAERYFAVGEADFRHVIEAIIEARPSFVFLTLIGTSAYQFFRDFRAACRARGIDQAREIPVASCSLSEPELEAIGDDAVDGHLSSSVYFCSIQSPENLRFLEAYEFPLLGGADRICRCGGVLQCGLAACAQRRRREDRRSARRQGGNRPPASRRPAGKDVDRRANLSCLSDAADRTL